MFKKFFRGLHPKFQQALASKNSPQEIALGFAVGTAIAILPTFGLGAIIGIILVLIFKKLNPVSLILAFIFWNPLLLWLSAIMSFLIGNVIFNDSSSFSFYNGNFADILWNYSAKFFLGNIILTTFLTIVSYVVVYYFISFYKDKSKK